jgi:hypothetical protein
VIPEGEWREERKEARKKERYVIRHRCALETEKNSKVKWDGQNKKGCVRKERQWNCCRRKRTKETSERSISYHISGVDDPD